jgi:hypothetical protein
VSVIDVEPMLSTREAAAALGVTGKGLISLVRSGQLVAHRLPPVGRRQGELRFDAAVVRETAEARATGRGLKAAARHQRWAEAEERRRRWEEYRAEAPRFSNIHRRELAAKGYVAGRPSRYRPVAARLPVEPLLALHPEASLIAAQRDIALGGGIYETNIHKALREGLTWMQADRWAVALGHHPAEVWGRAWWALDDDVRPAQ